MTKRLILEKALELFADKGYEGSSMDDIARAVGIRKASLYSHFDGKESIFAAIFEDILDEYAHTIDRLTTTQDGENAAQRLKSLFFEFVLYCRNNLKMYFWDRYFYYPPDFLKEYIGAKTLETQDVFLERICGLMERGLAEGSIHCQSVRSLSMAYYYMMIGLSMSVRLYDEAGLLRDTEAAWNGLFCGMEYQNGKGNG